MNYKADRKDTTMADYKKAFIEFMIRSGVLTFGDFITKSGRKTPYFVNTGNYKTGKQMAQLGEYYAACIEENRKNGSLEGKIDALFGPAYKGIPISVATAIALANCHQLDLNYCYNRKEAKDHGEGGTMVGYKLQDGDSVLIVEDVITAGTAMRECIPVLKAAADVRLGGLIISVDRMERGTGSKTAIQEIEEEFGLRTYPIVTVREILFYLNQSLESGSELSAESCGIDLACIRRMEQYMETYCVK